MTTYETAIDEIKQGALKLKEIFDDDTTYKEGQSHESCCLHVAMVIWQQCQPSRSALTEIFGLRSASEPKPNEPVESTIPEVASIDEAE